MSDSQHTGVCALLTIHSSKTHSGGNLPDNSWVCIHFDLTESSSYGKCYVKSSSAKFYHKLQYTYVLLMVSNSFCAPGVTLMPIFSAARRFCSRAEVIFLSILSTSRAGREGGGFVETSTTSSFFI